MISTFIVTAATTISESTALESTEEKYSVIYSLEFESKEAENGKIQCTVNEICKIISNDYASFWLSYAGFDEVWMSMECKKHSCIFGNYRASKFVIYSGETHEDLIFNGKKLKGLEWSEKRELGMIYFKILKD